MSQTEHARVAALTRHGSDPVVLAEARAALAAANLRKAADAQRASLGLPPLPDGLADVVTRAAFLAEAA